MRWSKFDGNCPDQSQATTAVRCEIKARAVDPFIGTTADVTCGADVGLVLRYF